MGVTSQKRRRPTRASADTLRCAPRAAEARAVSLTMGEKKTAKAIKRIQSKGELSPEDFVYDYNPDLTNELDSIKGDFDENIIKLLYGKLIVILGLMMIY